MKAILTKVLLDENVSKWFADRAKEDRRTKQAFCETILMEYYKRKSK